MVVASYVTILYLRNQRLLYIMCKILLTLYLPNSVTCFVMLALDLEASNLLNHNRSLRLNVGYNPH